MGWHATATARKLRTFARYGAGDQARLLAAAVLLAVVHGTVALVSFDWLRRALGGVAVAGSVVPGDPRPVRVAWAVKVADRHVPGERKCLHRSLTAETIHRVYGHDVAHCIGVDPTDESGFKAHSWIEYDGDVLVGDLPDFDRYEPLGSLDEVDPGPAFSGGG